MFEDERYVYRRLEITKRRQNNFKLKGFERKRFIQDWPWGPGSCESFQISLPFSKPQHISKKASLVVAMDFLDMFEDVPTSSELVLGLVAVLSRAPQPQNWFVVVPTKKTLNGPCGSTVRGPPATSPAFWLLTVCTLSA